jgi:hypothetical protein
MGSPVFGFGWNHPPDAAFWIHHITFSARDDVDVSVGNGLTCGCAIIDPDIEAIGGKTFLEDVPDLRDLGPQFGLFRFTQVKDAGYMAPGNDQRMSFGDRKPIEEGKSIWGSGKNPLGIKIAKRTFGSNHGPIVHKSG